MTDHKWRGHSAALSALHQEKERLCKQAEIAKGRIPVLEKELEDERKAFESALADIAMLNDACALIQGMSENSGPMIFVAADGEVTVQ